LAGLEKERSARGSRPDLPPLFAVFALGVAFGFVLAKSQ